MACCLRGPLFGMRATHGVQRGLVLIQNFVGCRALCLPLLRRPCNQVRRGGGACIFVPTYVESVVHATKPGYFQNRSFNFSVHGLVLPCGGDEPLEAEDLVQGELDRVDQEVCCFQAPALESHADYLSLTDKNLLAQCVVDTYRASGAGGQHRNKTDSAVRLKHSPTGMVGQAADDRSQHVNKALALNRLRHVISIKVRRPVELENYEPPLELLRILPAASTVRRARGILQQIGPNNSSYVKGMQALLDLFAAANGSVSETAPHLGLSTGGLSKLITSDRALWQAVNGIRAAKGLKPLR